jgi:hypothetical protein
MSSENVVRQVGQIRSVVWKREMGICAFAFATSARRFGIVPDFPCGQNRSPYSAERSRVAGACSPEAEWCMTRAVILRAMGSMNP